MKDLLYLCRWCVLRVVLQVYLEFQGWTPAWLEPLHRWFLTQFRNGVVVRLLRAWRNGTWTWHVGIVEFHLDGHGRLA